MNRRQFLSVSALAALPRVAIAQEAPTLYAFGDSITLGVGASSPDKAFAARVAGARNLALANYGLAGKQIQEIAAAVYGAAIPEGGQSLALLGFNDARASGTDAPGVASFGRAVAALSAWLALPESGKVRARSAAASGSWSPSPLYALGITSSIPGDALAFTVSGSVVYVGATALAAGGSFGVAIDGVPVADGECSGAVASIWQAAASSPFLVRVDGLSSGPHRVVITVRRGPVFIDWVGGNAQPCAAFSLAGPVYCTTAGYKFGFAPGTHGSDAAMILYNQAAQLQVKMLAADGLRVAYVDPNIWFDPDLDTAIPDIHPNDRGHERISAAFLSIAPVAGCERPNPLARPAKLLGFFSPIRFP